MFRRVAVAAFVLLSCTAGCQDKAASVQPDNIVSTAAPSTVAPSTAAPSTVAPSTAAPSAAAANLNAATASPSATTLALTSSAQPTSTQAAFAATPKSPTEPVVLNPNAAVLPPADQQAAPNVPSKHVAGGVPIALSAKASTSAPLSDDANKAKKGPKPTAKKGAKPAPKRASRGTAASELKVLKAGAQPHRQLRLKVKKGQVETMKMVLTMDMAVKELKQEQKLPPMAMTMRLKVAETRANGDIKYNFTLTETDVPGKGHDPRLVAGMKQAMQKIYGLSGYAVVSDRGMNREAKINMPPKVDAQTKQVMQGMEQAMQQIGAPLPVEAVGKGARWSYTTKLSQAGMKLTQVATYDLVSMKDGVLKLKARVKQTAPRQQVAAPTGQKLSLLSLKSKGKGKTRMSLTRLAPAKSMMKLKSAMKMGATGGKTMTIVTGMTIEIRSK